MSVQNDTPKVILNERQVRVAGYYEQVFWLQGCIPTVEATAQTLGESESYIRKQLEVDNFRQYLILRGVNLNPNEEGILTAEQLMLANLMLNAHDRRTEREKIKALQAQGMNVSSQKFHAWMRQPAFQNYMRKRAEDLFSASDWKVLQSLVDTAEDGDTSAMKLFFEMTGRYTPKQTHEFNIEITLAKIIEVIAIHVNPETMQAIADDIEKVLDGRPIDHRRALSVSSLAI